MARLTKAAQQENIIKNLHSWCSPEKRKATSDLIEQLNPKLIVEIGTWGGGWLLPSACKAPKATCIGVDPYRASASIEDMTTPANLTWWNDQVMHDQIYQGTCSAIHSLGLKNTTIVRTTSEEYISELEDNSIHIFHSDANHSAEPTMRNAKLYLPKLKVGGIFIQDDLGWGELDANGDHKLTVKPAVNWLLANGCQWMYEVTGAAFLKRVK